MKLCLVKLYGRADHMFNIELPPQNGLPVSTDQRGRRSEELRGRNLEPQGPEGRDARYGARSFRPATCRGPLGAAGRLPDRAVRTDQRGKYGTDAYDQWSVDELLTLAKGVAAQAL